MFKFCINHKNKNPRKNEIKELEVINITKVFKVLTTEEKRLINSKSICKDATIHEDTGKEKYL